MAERVTLDRHDPCGACGAPWSHLEKEMPLEGGGSVWIEVTGGGSCSARCQEQDPAAYSAELVRRERDSTP
jgi:hypothetical protein